MKDYDKKIKTQEKLMRIALVIATVLLVAGVAVRERLPWLLYCAAVPLTLMIVNTLLIKRYEKKQRAEEE